MSNNPLGYKFSWSAKGVLLAAKNSAKFLRDGQVVEIPAQQLFTPVGTKDIRIYPGFAFEGYPNRDSTPYGARYGIAEARTILRGTLRYRVRLPRPRSMPSAAQGTPAFIKVLADIGLLGDEQLVGTRAPLACLTCCTAGAARRCRARLVARGAGDAARRVGGR